MNASDGTAVTQVNIVPLAEENNLASLKAGYINVYGAAEIDMTKAGRYELVYILVDAKTGLRAEGDAVITIVGGCDLMKSIVPAYISMLGFLLMVIM